MDKPATLGDSLENGLAYLLSVQRADGGFDSYSSPSASCFAKQITYRTTFIPALMLGALSSLPLASSRRIRRPLARFLVKQRGPLGSFNYWAKQSPERQRRPYPDDLDDTACALIGLALNDDAALPPAELASLVRLLLATETQPGGPYRTWLVPADGPLDWQDIDVAVNANIAYLLSLVSEPLPGLTAFMEQAIEQERLASPYYPSSCSIIYYLARAYDGRLRPRLRAAAEHLARTADTQTALDQALLLSALIRLNEPDQPRLQALAEQLMAGQRPDGSWPAAAFCLDPVRAGIKYYNGSESLTTAFALEALQLYSRYSHPAKAPQPHLNRRSRRFDSAVMAAVRQDCRQLRPDLQTATLTFLRRVVRSDSGIEIVSLPAQFNRSLTEPLGQTFGPLLRQLGTANLYGWAAYTLFDDFLDDEGDTGQLPTAITTLRYSLTAFERALPDDPAFQQLVQQTYDTIDGANAWEVNHCRFERSGRYLTVRTLPDYSDVTGLADRSLGHTLTPLALLRKQGVAPDTKLFGSIRQAMVHYLTARQLNDDAHDWQTDLEHGHITYVVALILRQAGIQPGRYDLNTLIKRCQRQFWHHTLPEVCRLIRRQTALSRHCLKGLSELHPRNTFTELLDGIDTSVAQTLAAQNDAEIFLKHFTAAEQPVASV